MPNYLKGAWAAGANGSEIRDGAERIAWSDQSTGAAAKTLPLSTREAHQAAPAWAGV